jgi:hypothetical protein
MLRLFLKQIDTEPIWFDHDLPDASVDKIAIAAFLMLCIAFAQDLEDRLLDLGRRHAGDGAGFLLPTLQQRLRDIIAIPRTITDPTFRRRGGFSPDVASEARSLRICRSSPPRCCS